MFLALKKKTVQCVSVENVFDVYISQVYLGTNFVRSLLTECLDFKGCIWYYQAHLLVLQPPLTFLLMFFVQFFSNRDVLNQQVGNKLGSPGTVGSVSQLFEVEKVSNFLRLL